MAVARSGARGTMLISLAIKDLAIIDEATIEFASGLNVLTGETGAGKSIVIEALSLVLGDRARTDTIRLGASRAVVEALFRLPGGGRCAARLRARDLIDPEDDGDTVDLIVRRIVAPGGKGRVYVNGHLTTVTNLAEITRGLVDLSSQHQHTELLDPSSHLELLDRFGGLVEARGAYDAAWSAVERARAKRDALRRKERERAQREDFARFQLDEIEGVAPRPGEDDELDEERRRLVHAEALLSGAHEAAERLSQGRGTAAEQLLGAHRQLERLRSHDPRLEPLIDRVEAARIEVEDLGMEIAAYASGVDIDPRRLAVVNERLSVLERLKRKYGSDLAAVLASAAELRAEVEGYASLEDEVIALEAETEALEARARTAAEALSKGRRAAAERLAADVAGELTGLAMSGAALAFALDSGGALGPRGIDSGELHIQTNVGEGFGPLVRVASGGELSRVLLALKRVLIDVDPVDTCIFDEVDAGTGGAVADVIGMKLGEIAKERQVIAITHLAQIAARGVHHLRVEKTISAERTVTRVRALDPDERTEEIARMLGGVAITPRVRAHAQELLAGPPPGPVGSKRGGRTSRAARAVEG